MLIKNPAASSGVSKDPYGNFSEPRHPRMFESAVQFRSRLDFRRRTDPSEAVWRTRLKHAGMTDLGLPI